MDSNGYVPIRVIDDWPWYLYCKSCEMNTISNVDSFAHAEQWPELDGNVY